MLFVCFVYDVAMLSENPLRWVDPRTWPWPVYVWLAIIAAGWLKPLWRRVQHSRAKSWPITTGQIESVTVNESKFRRRSSAYTAELGYSYSVSGKVEDGLYKREFNSEEEAWEFVRDLKGKPVAVHYNPDKPSASTLSEESVETLLRTRAPKPATEMPVSANHIPSMVSPFLWVFVILSAVGLVVSLWVHVGAVMGRRVAPEAFFWILHIGIFVVWFPAIFVAKARIGNLRRKDFWKAVLQGSPGWMRYMAYGFLGYAVLNFAWFMLEPPTGESGANPPAIVWRGFSGHWMAFYSAALAILYSAAIERTTVRKCVNGHPVQTGATFCSRCGQPAMHG
jgi:hypothetical protein